MNKFNLPEKIVIFDSEYTTWEGTFERRWSGPNEYREIVEIGAIKINTKDLSEEDSFSIFVKPTKNPILSEYFTNLTGITQKEVDEKGVSLKEGIDKFVFWVDGLPLYSWGNDCRPIKENCELLGKPCSFAKGQCRDVREIFNQEGMDVTGYMSSTIVRAFGKEPKRNAHNSIDDSRQIIDALKELAKKSQ